MIIDPAVRINIDKVVAKRFSTRAYNNCNDFAVRCAKTNNYPNMNKIVKDITIGKLAEIYAHKILYPFYPNLTLPDFTIYPKGKKSFSADLSDITTDLSVKAQDINQAKKHGESWTFAKHDKSLYIPNPNHFAVFVVVDIYNRICKLAAIVSVDKLNELQLFGEMNVEWLRQTKKCVYMRDLEAKYK
jgi:hypothetical protein